MIGGWIENFGKSVGAVEDTARKTYDQTRDNLVSHADRFDKHVGQQVEGLIESFDYDDREAISGEARALHPNSFAQFTPAKIIGVSRIPGHIATGGRWLYNHRGTITKPWNKLNNLNQNLKNSRLGKVSKPRNPLPRTTAQLKKSPRVTGTATGTIIGTILAGNITNQKQDSNGESDWIHARKQKRHNLWRLA